LVASGSISNSPLISLASGTLFDVSAAGGIALNGAAGGQVLAGKGGVCGNVTSVGSTRLSPGGDGVIGTLTLSNNFTLNGGTVTINANGGSRDLLDVKGNLDLTAGTIALNNLGGPIASGTYKLITYSGTLSGDIAEVALSGFSQPGQLASLTSEHANEIDLVIVTGFGAELTWLDDRAGNLWNLISALNFTNSAGVVTNFHNNDAVNFTDAGTANPGVNLAGSLTAASVKINFSADYTFQGTGRLSGGSILIKDGPNNLTILTTNNYTGPTIINNGTLTLGTGIADGSFGIGSLTNNAALVFNDLGDQTVSGALNSSGSITFHGAANVTLANAEPRYWSQVNIGLRESRSTTVVKFSASLRLCASAA
jgi:fibronectin-binding autotransporter adhesin